ncbi:MAG: hypothetical protein M9909_04370 [Thermomicrobiales bacterium]|nr:hypothetical protein [Thermomicrobiales bacterium]
MELTITSDLLLDLAEHFASLPLLVIGGEAALANAFDADTTFQPTDIRERDNARVSVIDSPNPASFATGLLPAPPDRDLLRRHLLTAATALQPDGLLIIAGANAEGGKTAIKDAEELFGPPTWNGYREKHRLAMFRGPRCLLRRGPRKPGSHREHGRISASIRRLAHSGCRHRRASLLVTNLMLAQGYSWKTCRFQ